MTRGQVYTGRVNEALNQAKALAPTNPRVYLLLANDLYFPSGHVWRRGRKSPPAV